MSAPETLVCSNDGCENEFVQRTHNMKYCSDECCRVATNKRIMEKYYEKKARRNGTTRYCRKCNETELSRYNDSNICSLCRNKKKKQANDQVIEMLFNSLTVN